MNWGIFKLRRSVAALAIGLISMSGLVALEAKNPTPVHAAVLNLDAPVVTAISAPAPNQLQISFTAPSNPSGLNITAYQIEYSTNGSSWTTATDSFSPTAGTMSYTISDLAAGTAYYLRVAAVSGGLGSYGYKWEKIYSTQSPSRDVNSRIVYDAGFGLGGSDAAATFGNAAYSRIRYRMGVTYDGTAKYVDANFSKNMTTVGAGSETYTSASDLRYLRIPTADDGIAANQFEIQGDVSDLTVFSNVSGVTNGSGFNGRVEIWPWNYDPMPNSNISARASAIYDDGDSWNSTGYYGSFQLHRLDSSTAANNKTIFAWNLHINGTTPEIGFGDNVGTHTDWTFCSNGQSGGYTCQARSDFSLGIYVNPTMSTLNSVNVSYNLNGGTGTTPATASLTPSSSTNLAASTGFNKPGFNFAGWSDGSTVRAAGSSYVATSTSVTMTAQWSNALVLDYDVTDTASYTSGTTLTNRISSYPNATLSSSNTHSRSGQVLAFSGGSHATVGSISSNLFSNGLTLDVYGSLGADSTTAWERFVDFGTVKLDGYANNSFNLLAGRHETSNKVQIEIHNQTSGTSSIGHCMSNDDVLDNTIHRYTFVLNGSACALYVDGVQKNVRNSLGGAAALSIPYGLPLATTWNLNYIAKSNWQHLGDPTTTGNIRSIRLLGNASTPAIIDQIDSGRLVYKSVSYASTETTSAMPATDKTTGTLALPTASMATRSGFSLANWFTSSARTTVAAGPGVGYLVPSSSVTLYAGWAGSTQAVNFDTQGGSPAVPASTFQVGGTIANAPTTSPSKVDHVFAGWAASPGGSPVTFPYSPPEVTDITLYATWTALTTVQSALTVTSTSGTYGTALTLSTSGGSGTGAVTYAVNNGTASGCQVSGGSLTANSAGTCLITATKTSDGFYLSESSAATAVTFARKPLSVTAGSVTINAGGGFSNTFTAGTLAGSDAISVVTYTYTGTGSTSYGPSTVSPTAPGTYSITPAVTTMSSGNLSNYDLSYTSGTLTVSAIVLNAPTTVSASANSGVAKSLVISWGAVSHATNYTLKISSGGTEIFTTTETSTSVTLTDARLANATTYDITVRANGTGNYSSSAFSSVFASAATNAANTITYVYNGATAGASVANSSFITGGTAITLPAPTRTNYSFDGWFTDIALTNQIAGAQSPTSSFSIYAKWTRVSFEVSFNLNYTAGATSQVNVLMGDATTLPNPSRANFVLDGWYSAATGGSRVGGAGDSFNPTETTTLHARWTQSSLQGINPGNLSRVGALTANDLVSSGYNGTLGANSVEVTVPSASLPAGTVVNLDLITDTSYAQSLITGSNTYILSLAVSWIAPDETVPAANPGKYVQVKITNPAIKVGDLVYSVQGGVATLLATATANGTITIRLETDPSVYLLSVPVAPVINTPVGGSAPAQPAPPVTPVTPPQPVEPEVPVTPETPETPKLVIVKVPASRVVFATESGRKPTLIGNKIIDPILFDPFSTKLDSRDMQRLKTVTQKLKGEAGTLLVTGFVKYVGASKAVMVKIATERAKAVTKFLASLGIKVKIAYAGFGPHTTLNPNSSDRRVELRWAPGQ